MRDRIAPDGVAASNLLPAQRHLWAHDDLAAPESHVVAAYEIGADLDPAMLERALTAVVRRQEALRTYFRAFDGIPVRLVTRGLVTAVHTADLSGLAEPGRSAELARRLAADARTPLTPTAAPLFRVSILRLEEGRAVLSLVLHRLIADDFSPAIFLAELWDACARPDAQPPPLTRLADLVAAERLRPPGDRLPAGAFLARRGGGGREHDLGGARAGRFLLPAAMVDRLAAVGGSGGAAAALVGGVAVLLARAAGDAEVGVGVLTPERDRPGTSRLIAPLAVPRLVRVRLDDDPAARTVLRRVRAGLALPSAPNGKAPDAVVVLDDDREPLPPPARQLV
ncbi:MAG: hypothetical protein HOW59_36930, partial [Nonomuraea sp.]|nr:hypothetical protein [Nonomuraea sp.]